MRESRIPLAEWTSADEASDIAGYGVGWLRFTCGADVLRLRLYPREWQHLSDAAVESLRRRARSEPDPKRSRA